MRSVGSPARIRRLSHKERLHGTDTKLDKTFVPTQELSADSVPIKQKVEEQDWDPVGHEKSSNDSDVSEEHHKKAQNHPSFVGNVANILLLDDSIIT